MKIFAEIISTEKETTLKDFKIGVKDVKEAKDKIATEELNWVGLNYQKRIHQCFHDESTNKPCQIQIL